MAKRTSITLVPTTFRLLVNVNKEEQERLVLLGNARLSYRESVKLATEENFTEMVGGLRLIEQEGEERESDKPIGWMSYLEEFQDNVDLIHEKARTYLKIVLAG
jgi:hypothetical protein